MTTDEQDPDQIIAECTETLDTCPGDIIALLSRGRAWFMKQNYDEAIADVDRVLDADDHAEMRYWLDLSEAGLPMRLEAPNWRQRWA